MLRAAARCVSVAGATSSVGLRLFALHKCHSLTRWGVLTCVQVRVLCPDVEDNEALNGQILEVEVSSLTDSVGDIKARLADVLKLAANKQRISRDGVGVLRDENTLAFYNVGPETMLSLAVRERGGRKK